MRSLAAIVLDARHATDTWAGTDLAKALGCSAHTVYRHPRTGGVASEGHHHRLIRLTHAKDPALAAEYAAAVGTSLAALGLGEASSSGVRTEPAHADLVVYAAADVLDLSPRRVRPALAAAFLKAQELRVPVEGLVPHLTGKAKGTKTRKK